MKKITILSFLLLAVALLMSNTSKNVAKQNTALNEVQQSKAAGEKVFKKYCITCHMADGSGVPHMNPPLIQTTYVLGEKEKLIKIVLNGFQNVDIDDETYTNKMPPLKTVLKDQQIADVLTYVRNSFGNKASAVSVAEVKAVRDKNK